LFKPDPAIVEYLTNQVFFTAWLYTLKSDSGKFKAAELANLPTSDDFLKAVQGGPSELDKLTERASAAMQATLTGETSWRGIMISTMNRAQEFR
jgi:hypothetical protein